MTAEPKETSMSAASKYGHLGYRDDDINPIIPEVRQQIIDWTGIDVGDRRTRDLIAWIRAVAAAELLQPLRLMAASMTAEPRDVEEIRGDGKITDEALGDAIDMLIEVEAAEAERDRLRAELERKGESIENRDDLLRDLRAENAELRGEVERLRELVARQLGDCIGCSPETGPEETCPHDGRTYTEWVEIASMVIGRQHDTEAERDDLRAQLAAAQAQLADARVEVGRTRALCDRYPGARPGGAALPNLPEVRDATEGPPMTRPDATLAQLHLVIDWAKDQGLHDAEQWLRERVAAAEERMGVRDV